MEKKRLEILSGVIEGFNLTFENVVDYWINTKRLNSKYLERAVKQAKSLENSHVVEATKKIIRSGMFVYASGLISDQIIEEEQITSVVGAILGNKICAVCLQECLPWSSGYLKVGTQNVDSGKEATKMILEAARKHGIKAEAAEWCANYAYDRIERGEGFLPSLEELKAIQQNKKAINVSLKRLGACELSGWYLSSTESISYYSWELNMDDGSNHNYDKGNIYHVRAMLEFEV